MSDDQDQGLIDKDRDVADRPVDQDAPQPQAAPADAAPRSAAQSDQNDGFDPALFNVSRLTDEDEDEEELDILDRQAVNEVHRPDDRVVLEAAGGAMFEEASTQGAVDEGPSFGFGGIGDRGGEREHQGAEAQNSEAQIDFADMARIDAGFAVQPSGENGDADAEAGDGAAAGSVRHITAPIGADFFTEPAGDATIDEEDSAYAAPIEALEDDASPDASQGAETSETDEETAAPEEPQAPQNRAPSDISLDGDTVSESDAGAVIGRLSAYDPDGGAQSWSVDDSRFEVVGGELKLKPGVSLDYETDGAEVSVSVTVTDAGGLSYTESFAISVSDVAENSTVSGVFVDEGVAETSITGSAAGDDITTHDDGGVVHAGDGYDTVTGGAGDDEIHGGTGFDTISGGAGDDVLYGDEGKDTLSGGDGADTIFGGAWDDTIDGGEGDDTLYGETGKDTIDGGAGNDTISGGDWDDTLRGGEGDDTISGDNGLDYLDGGEGDDVLSGGSHTDTLLGGAGADVLDGGSGDDAIDGGEGADVVVFTGNWADYTITEADGVYTVSDNRPGSPDGTDTVENVELFRFADGDASVGDVLNDGPVGVDDSASVSEDAAGVSGDVLANDTDADIAAGVADSLSVAAVDGAPGDVGAPVNGSYGSVTINADGTYSYSLDNSLPAVQALNVGDSVTETFTYTVTDEHGATDTATLTITIDGTNDGPAITSDGGGSTAAVSIDEGQAAVTTIASSDVDAGSDATYSIVGGADAALFTINPDSGALTFVSAPSFEDSSADADDVYEVTVQVTDEHGATDTQTLSVTVDDVNNQSQVFTSGTTASASEATDDTTTIYTATATDADTTGEAITFSLTDDAGGLFEIDPTTGVVTLADGQSLDYESATSHDITIQSSDGTNTSTQTVTISVTDENDVGQVFTSGTTASTSEATDDTTTIYTATATDADTTGEAITFSLTDDAGGLFEIDPTTGVVTLADGQSLDYESAASHDITIQSSDGTNTSTQTVTISVTDENDVGQVFTSGTTASTSEATDDTTTIYTATATDADTTGEAITFSLTDDAGGLFEIDAATGVVTLADGQSLDYESATSHDITIQSSDGVNTSTQTVTISVTDENDVGQVFTSGTTASTSEATDDTTTIYTATATDADTTGEAITFSLTDDAGGLFEIDPTTGVVTLADGQSLDYESATSHDITIQSSDGTNTSTQTVTISVTDENDVGQVFTSGTTASASEATDDTTTIYTATATDADTTGEAITFSLTDDAGGLFEIDPTTGVVTLADGQSLDYESATSHDITIQSSDGTNTSTQTVTISVTDENDVGQVFTSGTTASTSEATDDTTTIYTATATDADTTGEAITFSLTDDAGGRFEIDAATGVVTLADGQSLDYESAASHDITIQSSDGVNTSTQTVTISVTDVAEATSVSGIFVDDGVAETSITGSAGADDITAHDDGGTIEAGAGDDTITGGAGADTAIFSGDYADYAVAYDGDTDTYTLTGPDGTDTVTGVENFQFDDQTVDVATLRYNSDQTLNGDGDANAITGGAGDDTISGSDGDDTLTGGAGDDALFGGDGDDTIYDGDGADTMDGGEGSDSYYLEHNVGKTGSNVFNDTGSSGTDTIFLTETGSYELQSDFSHATTGIEVIDGTAANGEFVWNNEADGVNFDFTDVTLVGVDSIRGTAHDDSIIGSAGDDDIRGGDGDDTLAGGAGDDRLDGGAGTDTAVFSGDYADYTVAYDGDIGAYTVTGPDGTDTVTGVEFFQFDDQTVGEAALRDGADQTLNGTGGGDALTGGSGDDTITGGAGDDAITGGAGSDTAVFSGDYADYAVAYDGDTGAYTLTGPDGTDTVTGVENFQFDDQTVGEAALRAAADQTLNGTAGDDALSSGTGDDSINGGDGADTIDAGAGDDAIDGGAGSDTAVFSGNYADYDVAYDGDTDTYTLTGPDGTDTVTGVENFQFDDQTVGEAALRDGADQTLNGTGGGDALTGGSGDDTITGGAGDDTIDGGAGSDTAVFSGDYADYAVAYDGDTGAYTLTGPDGTDTVTGVENFQFDDQTVGEAALRAAADQTLNGTAGDDALSSGTGDDSINGGDGADTIDAGAGDDAIDGGAGSDTAVFSGNYADYDVAYDGDTGAYILTGPDGTDTVTGVEFFQFDDQTVGEAALRDGADQTLNGTGGDDALTGGSGDDTLSASETVQGWRYEYYDNDSGVGTLAEAGFSENGGRDHVGSPDAVGVTSNLDPALIDAGDTFALKFSTTLTVTEAGDYTFQTYADDGVKLFLNGVEIINDDGDHGARAADSAAQSLAPGEYSLEVVYFENFGDEILDVRMAGPDTGGVMTSLADYEGANTTFDNDTIDGGAGTDTAVFSGDYADYDVNYDPDTDTYILTGPDGTDTVTGVENFQFDDQTVSEATLRSEADLTLNGGGGDDTLTGGGNDDEISGGGGADTLDGGAGDDLITGGVGDDAIDGGAGTDTAVFSGNYADYHVAYDGDTDTYTLTGPDGTDTVTGVEFFQFDDQTVSEAVLREGADQTINGTAAGETIATGSGDDTINAGSGDDIIDAGAGDDRIFYGDGDDTVHGGAGDDYIDDVDGAQHTGTVELYGDEGDDTIYGGDGVSVIDGGADNDRIYGEGGDDTLTGGAGNDTIYGGAGEDTAVFSGDLADYEVSYSGGAIIVTDTRNGSPDGTDTLYEVENLQFADRTIDLSDVVYSDGDYAGTGGADVVAGGNSGSNYYGNGGNDVIAAGGGDDYLNGGEGDDLLMGQDGNDTIYGGDGADEIHGGDGNDTLHGESGNNEIYGGAGDDIIVSGSGNDILAGGDGVDNISAGDGDDLIIAQMGGGNDTIDGGANAWTDTIELQDANGGGDIGEYGVDWTVSLTSGSIEAVNGNSLDLSDHADGSITLSDGTEIQFEDIEQIQW